MASLYDFEIVTRYDLDAEPEELTAIVLDPAMVLKWRPRVIMHSKLLDERRPDGQGIAVRLYVKGWLPYGLAFTARIAWCLLRLTVISKARGVLRCVHWLRAGVGPGSIGRSRLVIPG